ncbi:hypothetical protein, partial [Klebsiella pneumoniae]|uniref:hypothetical protein n=1 Tax=Klebsiella pneumoniae TaxID=573 RepID=UPI0025A02EE6
MTDLDYLALSKSQKIGYKIGRFFAALPKRLLDLLIKIPLFFWGLLKKLGAAIATLVTTFIHGD